jgi:hypothetical protein
MNITLLLPLMLVAAPAVESTPSPTTRLYVRTLPPGATVTVDGESLGTSDGLFLVPPGVRKVSVELDGYGPQVRQIEVRQGWISRVEIELKDPWAGWTHHPPESPTTQGDAVIPSEPTPIHWVDADRVYLSHVDDTAETWQVRAGKCTVWFQRPAASSQLVGVEIFATIPPDLPSHEDDFEIVLMDERSQVIKRLPRSYGELKPGPLQWHTLPIEPTEVPERFFIGFSFKVYKVYEDQGITLGIDGNVSASHSRLSLPAEDLAILDTEPSDWMIRAVLTPAPKNVEIR